jgi:hypothetical protein
LKNPLGQFRFGSASTARQRLNCAFVTQFVALPQTPEKAGLAL